MFDITEYELLYLKYTPKDEYITAKQYICLKQMKQTEYENNKKYEQIFLNTYNDIVENGYNISML